VRAAQREDREPIFRALKAAKDVQDHIAMHRREALMRSTQNLKSPRSNCANQHYLSGLTWSAIC
jgi:hypothetical protein